MPNRILKESICMSDSINVLSPQAEILFYRLIVQCDDYGRLDARPSVLRARCYPLRIDTISDTDISKWVVELIKAKIISLYTTEEKAYLQILNWNKHQTIRAKRSKYPEPDIILNDMQACDFFCKHMQADANIIPTIAIRNHLQTDASKCSRNPIQSNPIQFENPNLNPNTSETKVSDIVVKLTDSLKVLMLENNPNVKLPESFNKWQLEIDKMIRLDKRKPDEIEDVIIFSQNNNFWKTNILSTSSLREKYDTLYMQMNRNNHGDKDGQYGINRANTKEVAGNEPAGAFAKYEERDKDMSNLPQ